MQVIYTESEIFLGKIFSFLCCVIALTRKKQAEAEVVPRSSLVDAEVKAMVGVEVKVEVGVGVGVEVGVGFEIGV